MSQKGDRNQNLQMGKAERAHNGYLPSMERGKTHQAKGDGWGSSVAPGHPEGPEPWEEGRNSGVPIREEEHTGKRNGAPAR